MDRANAAQREFLDLLISAAGPMARILEAQFAGCRTWIDETCSECFYVQPTLDSARLPSGKENPLAFSATADHDPLGATVYLWHTSGLVELVEISWYGEQHPTLGQLRIEADEHGGGHARS